MSEQAENPAPAVGTIRIRQAMGPPVFEWVDPNGGAWEVHPEVARTIALIFATERLGLLVEWAEQIDATVGSVSSSIDYMSNGTGEEMRRHG